MKILELGKVSLSRVVESESLTSTRFLFPDLDPDVLEKHQGWLAPHFYNPAERKVIMAIQSYVLRTPHHTVLVDTCVGNHKKRSNPFWHMQENPYLETLAKAGVTVEEVDFVLCTHLHIDHVGWNTRLSDGRWVPTFPNAKYLFAKTEWAYWKEEDDPETKEIMEDSVTPIFEAGQVDLVDGTHQINEELQLEPTPGHTPGHVSLHISSQGDEGVITGDMMHHPLQIGEPDLCSGFCVDKPKARATRRAFLEKYAQTETHILGTHFATPSFGRVVPHLDAWKLLVE